MELTQAIELIRYRGGEQRQAEDRVIREYEFELLCNGVCVERGTCIREHLEAMARGFLLTEGLVAAASQVRSIQLAQGRMTVEADNGAVLPLEQRRLPPAHWTEGEVMRTAGRFLLNSELFRDTGSVHSALLSVEGAERYFCEDIGRHNAIDKVVGMAMADGVDFSQTILYTSGRLPVGMARKAVRAGIPAMVSRSAPTDLTLELARRTGLTVIGFAREDRMNLYVPV